MTLLLLLSALLSALSGAGGAARPLQPAVAVCRAASGVVVAKIKPARRAGQLVATIPSLTEVARAARGSALRLSATVLIYLSRRRE